jgi:anaerobic dimethyl sulfoxide reductase subunit B
MSKQYGFSFDGNRCVGCWNCVIACKSVNNLQAGIQWIRLTESWEGDYPEVTRKFLITPCLHCENPPCLAACLPGAIFKRSEDGIIVVDRDKCTGCRECLTACPYSVPQFGPDSIMQRCDFCLSAGTAPACAASCPAEALKSGPLNELVRNAHEKHKQAKRLDGKANPGMVIVT